MAHVSLQHADVLKGHRLVETQTGTMSLLLLFPRQLSFLSQWVLRLGGSKWVGRNIEKASKELEGGAVNYSFSLLKQFIYNHF